MEPEIMTITYNIHLSGWARVYWGLLTGALVFGGLTIAVYFALLASEMREYFKAKRELREIKKIED